MRDIVIYDSLKCVCEASKFSFSFIVTNPSEDQVSSLPFFSFSNFFVRCLRPLFFENVFDTFQRLFFEIQMCTSGTFS